MLIKEPSPQKKTYNISRDLRPAFKSSYPDMNDMNVPIPQIASDRQASPKSPRSPQKFTVPKSPSPPQKFYYPQEVQADQYMQKQKSHFPQPSGGSPIKYSQYQQQDEIQEDYHVPTHIPEVKSPAQNVYDKYFQQHVNKFGVRPVQKDAQKMFYEYQKGKTHKYAQDEPESIDDSYTKTKKEEEINYYPQVPDNPSDIDEGVQNKPLHTHDINNMSLVNSQFYDTNAFNR